MDAFERRCWGFATGREGGQSPDDLHGAPRAHRADRLGESIVAVGVGLAGHQPRPDTVVAAVLRLTVAAAFWWLYFDGEDEHAERMLDAAAVDRASWLAQYGFGYAFLPLLGGIIMFAAGVENAVIQRGEPLTASTAWFLAAGVATYLVGLAWFRQLLGIGPPARAWRWPPPYCPTSGQPTSCEALPQGDRRDLHPG
jgi:Bacterial low temperature requirement A protein (LtrA)